MTGDRVTLVRPSLENAPPLLDVIGEFGFPVTPLAAAAIVDRRALLEMGVRPFRFT